MSYAYGFDIGKLREQNEDRAVILKNDYGDIFMMVFDGIGGHNLGDLASSEAQNYLTKCFKQKKKIYNRLDMRWWLKSSILKTNKYLSEYAKVNPLTKGMGTTFACFLIHQNHVLMAYLGDTRAYVIKGDKMTQLSEDETYVNFLYQSGKITKDEMDNHPAKHVVTNALGCYSGIIVNIRFIKEPFDYLLLCSDGLYKMVDEEQIINIIRNNHNDVEKSVHDLINKANELGGRDNIGISLYYKEGSL